MKNLIHILLVCLLSVANAQSQNNCTPLNYCPDAPLFCGHELERQIFNNNVQSGGGQTTLCGIAPHNSVWFRILPCSPQLELVINTLTSQTGDGLQVALFENCDATNEIACDPGTDMGAGIPLHLSATVSVGNEYWLMVDGYVADICDFTIDIISGIDTMAPLPSSGGPYNGSITGPTGNPCSSIGIGTYTVTWPDCNNWTGGGFSCGKDSCVCIQWDLPLWAVILGDPCASTITVDFSNCFPGTYLIKATPECTCAEGLCENCGPICCPVNPATLLITISAPSVVLLPEIKICFDDFFPDCVFDPGGGISGQTAWCQVATDPINCTIIRQPYRRINPIFVNLGTLFLCDTAWVCGTPYTQAGNYAETCTSVNGCDSTNIFVLIKDPACIFNCQSVNNPGPPGDSCQLSPFFCGSFLENYCGSNAGLTDDTVGGVLFQNTGFIRFQSCSDSVAFQVGVSNCSPGSTGLAFGLFEGNCPTTGIVTTEVIYQNEFNSLIFNDLDPSLTYTLVISGVNDSECQFNLQVLTGIGTGIPGPATCDCTDGFVEGPSVLCPGDVGTYTFTPPDCTISGGMPVGGNGYYCTASNGNPAPDSITWNWHIPSGTHFLGDSTGYTIQITADSAFFDLDTIVMDSVWISWALVSPPPADTLSFCVAGAVQCHYTIHAQPIQIQHFIDYEYCELSCVVNQCVVAGQTFDQPGSYVVDVDNCHRVLVTIINNTNMPNPPIVPPQTICAGASVQLTVINAFPPYLYFWDNGVVGPSITVSPANTTSYNIIVSDPQNGCVSYGQTVVAVIPVSTSNAGQIGVITCSQPCIDYQGQTYCQPGNYTLTAGLCSTTLFSIGSDPTLPIQNLPPVTICAGDCFDFFGQLICEDSLATHVSNCTLFVQQVTILPILTENAGIVGTVNCSQPCFDFQGVTYCAPGAYSIPGGQCVDQIFEIVFEKETLELGEIGKITCTESCILFDGQSYCNPGNYTTEDSCFIKNFSIGANLSNPDCSAPVHQCQQSNTHYTVAFSIGGQPPFKVNSQEINGSNFLSAPQLNGSQYAFIVEQSNGCQQVVTGTFDCASMCSTDAGTLSPATLHGCAGQSALEVQSLVAAALSPGDITEYWLQTTNGTILSQNTTGNFVFDSANMNLEALYFIRRVVGPPDLNGHPDLTLPCSDSSSVQPIVFHALPTVQVSGETNVCGGNSLTINAWGAISYLWNDGSTADVASFTTPVSPQNLTYSVVGTNVWGCTNSASFAVNILEQPVLAEVVVRPPVCPGDENGLIEIKLAYGNQEPLAFALNGEAFGTAMIFNHLSAGAYLVSIQDAFGCDADSLFLLPEPVPMSVDIGPDQQISIGESIIVHAMATPAPSVILWSSDLGWTQNGSLEWSLHPLQNTLIQCEVLDSNGCVARDEKLILVKLQDGIYRPNVLMSSALQSENQSFTLYAAEGWITEITALSIFDRWGELVWQHQHFPANAVNHGWNGTFKGSPAPPGVYVYQAEVQLANGDRIALKGDVTVIR